VLTDIPASPQTFALYCQRFGSIETHFKDYKSAVFEMLRSRIRDAQALSRLLMLLAAARLTSHQPALRSAPTFTSLGKIAAL
jgi:hypothetical protein